MTYITFTLLFKEKCIIFSNISLLRLGDDMRITIQNITESKKNQLTMSRHSKKFSFRLEA